MFDEWPKYYKDLIICPNQSGDVGIICGWTKKEKIFAMLNDDILSRVGAIGQLYSADGINYIIRNIFLNPNITSLIVTGLDMSDSIDTFRRFLTGELEDGIIHKEIPKNLQDEFIKWFGRRAYFVNIDKLTQVVAKCSCTGLWRKTPVSFPDPEYQEATDFPSEETGMRVEDGKIADCWLKILDRIMKFGRNKKSQYSDMQRELIALVSIISDEDVDKPFLPDFLTFNKKKLDEYLPQVMTAEIPDGLEYTYGSRFRSPRDQIQSIIDQVNEEDYTRRAVAVTWNVQTDDGNPKAPCLVMIQALVSSGKLYLTCTIRSNDMFGAWPQNAFALRNIQKEIAVATGKEMGKLTIISVSAHIYERDYERALTTVQAHKPRVECVHDLRGNFVIRLRDERIRVTHLSLSGRPLQKFEGKTAQSLMEQICLFVSDVSHAIYLGTELQRAEIALMMDAKFVQK